MEFIENSLGTLLENNITKRIVSLLMNLLGINIILF